MYFNEIMNPNKFRESSEKTLNEFLEAYKHVDPMCINSMNDNHKTLKNHIEMYNLESDQEKLAIAFNYYLTLDSNVWGILDNPTLLLQYMSIDVKRVQTMKDEIKEMLNKI